MIPFHVGTHEAELKGIE